jgi:signal transduction histidine kinase
VLSTRAKITGIFVAALIALAAALFLSFLTARNASFYQDVGQSASTKAELAARVLRTSLSSGQPVVVTGDTLAVPALTSRITNFLDALPGFLLLVDTSGRVIYRSPEVRQLDDWDLQSLQNQLTLVPASGAGRLLQLDSLGERVLLVSEVLSDAPGGVKRIVAGGNTSIARGVPREYIVSGLFLAPLIIVVAGAAAYLLLARIAKHIDEVTHELTAITDGRSLHKRLAPSDESREVADLIATLNAMIARLETSFSGLRRFTADASHELKTPLAVLRADVERAMSERAPQTERLIALEEALHEVTRMSDLVESLLTLARADEGRFDLHTEPVQLEPLVHEVYETALILGEAAGVTVNLPFTADVTIMGDRTRLRQLFLNLVTNAIKYTPPGGKVELGLGKHPDNVTFAVRDTGIGIAAADVDHIFERFWRADRVRSRTSERGGFGLGLAISQWIAQAHGGTLTASSRLGRGTLFTLTLPLPANEFIDS